MGKLDQNQEHGLAHYEVLDFMADFHNKNHHLYFDNFYLTVKLFQGLEQKSTYACGTIRSDCGRFPADFKENLGSLESGT